MNFTDIKSLVEKHPDFKPWPYKISHIILSAYYHNPSGYVWHPKYFLEWALIAADKTETVYKYYGKN